MASFAETLQTLIHPNLNLGFIQFVSLQHVKPEQLQKQSGVQRSSGKPL